MKSFGAWPKRYAVGLLPVGDFLSLGIEGSQLDVEDQRGVGRDRALRRLAVAKGIRDVYLPTVTDMHVLQSRGETVNNSADSKLCRRGLIHGNGMTQRRVKLIAVGITGRGDQPTGIVCPHGVGIDGADRSGSPAPWRRERPNKSCSYSANRQTPSRYRRSPNRRQVACCLPQRQAVPHSIF